METILLSILSTILPLWLGNIVYKLNHIEAYQKELITHEELQELVSNKLEAYDAKLEALKEDIHRIDGLLESMIQNKEE